MGNKPLIRPYFWGGTLGGLVDQPLFSFSGYFSNRSTCFRRRNAPHVQCYLPLSPGCKLTNLSGWWINKSSHMHIYIYIETRISCSTPQVIQAGLPATFEFGSRKITRPPKGHVKNCQVFILLMVQKSQGQSPGTVLKPCKYLDKNYRISTGEFSRISGCHQQYSSRFHSDSHLHSLDRLVVKPHDSHRAMLHGEVWKKTHKITKHVRYLKWRYSPISSCM